MAELLIGCGKQRKKVITFPDIPPVWTELTTLDIDPETGCSVVHDLENLPLPFDDDMFCLLYTSDAADDWLVVFLWVVGGG